MQRGAIFSRVVVGAVLVLAALAVADALRPDPPSDPLSSPSETVSIPEIERLSGRPAVEQVGDEWARRFAANNLGNCFHMGQPLCERLGCERAGHRAIPNCKVPTRAYRQSFEEAVVDDVEIKGYRAAARFSNGEVIELTADGGTWTLVQFGELAGRGFFE